MQEVVERLLTVPDLQLWLFGAPGEEATLRESWAQRWPGRVSNLASGLSFADQIRRMNELSLMISMDSANGHLASNAGVPVLTIWGTTHPLAGFAPYGQPADYQITPDTKDYPLLPVSIYGPVNDEHYLKAIHSIPPERIVRKALDILGVARGN
jgi:ADP-heptose:LPS heptosyltransferase